MTEKEHLWKHHMPLCSVVGDLKDSDTFGPLTKGSVVAVDPFVWEQCCCSHPQLPQTSLTVGHQWWPWWWRWRLSSPWPSLLLGWAPRAGSSRDSCPDSGVLGGASSEPLPASWWLGACPEGNWHFVHSISRGFFSWEVTCVKGEQLCHAPALISC